MRIPFAKKKQSLFAPGSEYLDSTSFHRFPLHLKEYSKLFSLSDTLCHAASTFQQAIPKTEPSSSSLTHTAHWVPNSSLWGTRIPNKIYSSFKILEVVSRR